MFDDVLRHRSGRVIALARAVLAAVFLLAIWIDPSQPAQSVAFTYAMLGAYVVTAAALAVISWNSWWIDARLAALAHVVDIVVFTLLVLATDGYTSPFFVFFVFLVLSAAIRWGWRETAATAVAVILLYFTAGMLGGDIDTPDFDLQRFIIRSANLVILSAILIWFGINQDFGAPRAASDEMLGDLSPDEPPLEAALRRTAALVGAGTGHLLWWAARSPRSANLTLKSGEVHQSEWEAPPAAAKQPFLFDTARDRGFRRSTHRKMIFSTARSLLGSPICEHFPDSEGLAVPIRTEAGEGLMLLCDIDGLCTDHVDYGTTLGIAASAQLQRHALLQAVKESAGARARLSLARDLHDSIVQFLAGATFRIEAIRRAMAAGQRPEHELQDLKELLLQEQQELRSAIGALRSNSIPLPRLAEDLEELCGRLSRQWDISCSFSADVPQRSVPMRLHLDTHQLVREAVANAVRHAKATTVAVDISGDDEGFRLEISNDGDGGARLAQDSPWSLRERVDEADGTLMLATLDTGTHVTITLPLTTETRP
jgi:signal transduction histidine kinase